MAGPRWAQTGERVKASGAMRCARMCPSNGDGGAPVASGGTCEPRGATVSRSRRCQATAMTKKTAAEQHSCRSSAASLVIAHGTHAMSCRSHRSLNPATLVSFACSTARSALRALSNSTNAYGEICLRMTTQVSTGPHAAKYSTSSFSPSSARVRSLSLNSARHRILGRAARE